MGRQGARRKLDRCIYEDDGGVSVMVEVRGRVRELRFPLGTDLEVLLKNRDQLRADLRDVAPAATAARGRLAADAKRDLKLILPPSVTGWCYVYFARSGDVVKIGRAIDPAARLRDIQTMHAGELELLTAVATHATLEGALHARFAHLRTRAKGEWFRLEPDLVAFIQAIQRGANPVGLLFEDPRAWPRARLTLVEQGKQ
jgi:hypothetical protein